MNDKIVMLCLALKGGAVVKVPVSDWSVMHNAGSITKVRWTSVDESSDQLIFVNIEEVAAVWQESVK